MTILRTLALAALAIATPLGAQPTAQIPPELQAHLPRDLRPYFLAFLITPAQRRPVSPALFVQHQDYMRRQFEAGVYKLIGRLTDDGRIAGMVILEAPSAEAARAVVAADPIVQSGAFDIEVHPALLPNLASLQVEYPPRH